ncbi:MAG: HEAT repeat domain-containing protein [Chloroflexi bacterium]|nr:HEAT repeat domain-containing protein [Chloroflexota bacterium]
MPNLKIMKVAAERRREMRPKVECLYRQYRDQVPRLIRQLGGPTQAEHDRAFDLLSQMGEMVASELLDALADAALDDIAADEVVSLLGVTGDERAREPLWQFFQAHQDDLERASTAALSLASLGDDRVLPFLRQTLEADDEHLVSNAVAAMVTVGMMEDIPRLREIHRQHLTNWEIRYGIANAILTIVGETDQRTFDRTLDDIHASFADRRLWDDIWAILEREFGTKDITWH